MRLIDADALKTVHGMGDDCAECDKEERKKSTKCEYDRNFTKMDFCGWLDDAPTVDAVPVVRCRDCKRYQHEVGDDEYALGWCPFITIHLVSRNEFCSWGKRKEDGNAAD